LYNAAKALSCRNMRAMTLERRGGRDGDGLDAPLHLLDFANDAVAFLKGITALHLFPDYADPQESD
jgi:hypothetical protein